jgi:hypothetical protein
MVYGIATRITSRGNPIIFSPFNENITKIVNSNATGVNNETFGINLVKYQSLPFHVLNT